jgi:hypothetical protein
MAKSDEDAVWGLIGLVAFMFLLGFLFWVAFWAAPNERARRLREEPNLVAFEQHRNEFKDMVKSDSIDISNIKGIHDRKGCDLRLMPSVNHVSDIPKVGKNLIIVAAVDNVLHIRIFDGGGNVVVDTDEKRLTDRARQFEDLRQQLVYWGPPHTLDGSRQDTVITGVTSIVGHARLNNLIVGQVPNNPKIISSFPKKLHYK